MMNFKKILNPSLVIFAMLILTACQQTPINHSNNSSQTPIYLMQSDGVQDIKWTITQIRSKKALSFSYVPTLLLNSQQKTVIGNTGCNAISGRYQIDVKTQSIGFQARAGYAACNNALAQEADLMDALARIQSFQLQGKKITLYDANKNILIQAEQR